MRSTQQTTLTFGRVAQSVAVLSLTLGLASAAVVGCGASSTDDASQTLHDEDRPTRGTEEWMWAAGNEADYDRVIAPLLGLQTNNFLPSNHALVRKVQTWLDRLDGRLRSVHGAQMVNVPKPIARVSKDASVNAFVAPAPVCYSVTVKLRTSGTTVNQIYFDPQAGEFGEFPDTYKCLTGENVAATVRDFVQKFNAASTSCRLTLEGSTVVPSSSCKLGDDTAGIGSARKLVILEAASFVTVFAGLFPAMSEEAFVAVIAHELGHYYRAHTTSFEPDYDFFYQAKEDADARKPSADSSLKSVGQSAQLGTKVLSTTDMHMAVPGASLRPELYFATGSLINAVCDAGSCPASCASVKTLINSAAFDSAMGQFPFGYDASGVTSTYKSFETKARACLAALKVGASGVSGSAVSWTAVTELVRKPTWPEWIGQISPRAQRMLAEVAELTASHVGSAAVGTTLDAAFLRAGENLDSADRDAVTHLKRAVDARVGYYTAEEEADDEATEWLAAMGIDPKHGVDAMARLGKGLETGLGGYSLGESDCKTLQQRNWRDENGNYVFVPIGDFTEPHHSVCYRMFNMEREIDAHNFVADTSVSLPPMNGQAWKDLQDLAISVSRVNPIGPTPHGIVAGDRGMQCLFAPDFGWAK